MRLKTKKNVENWSLIARSSFDLKKNDLDRYLVYSLVGILMVIYPEAVFYMGFVCGAYLFSSEKKLQ